MPMLSETTSYNRFSRPTFYSIPQSYKTPALSDTDTDARAAACATLGNFGEKAATNEVIAALINATRNEDYYVRSKACEALGKLGEKAATDEVVAALINATRDKAYNVTWKAWKALRELGEKAVTNEMIAGLVNEHS
ncbi:unnamed protein product, partial [Rotaria magnacalcarata]